MLRVLFEKIPLVLQTMGAKNLGVKSGEYRLRSEDRLVAGDRRAMTRD